MIRQLLAFVLCCAVAAPALAGGIHDSATAAVQRVASQEASAAAQQTNTLTPTTHSSRNVYLWSGAILFAAGMVVSTYGFLHTTDGDFVEPSDASTLSKTGVGIGGLGIAAAGGAVMFLGTRQPSPSVTARGSALSVAKRISW